MRRLKQASLLLFVLALAGRAVVLEEFNGTLQSQRLALRNIPAGKPLGFAFSLSQLASGAVVKLVLRDSQGTLLEKTLHEGDLDVYVTLRPPSGTLTLDVDAPTIAEVRYRARLTSWPESSPIELEPNNTPAEATPVRLGQTVFASADDVPYLPQPGSSARPYDVAPDWYRFEFGGATPKLVYFWIDLVDRDNIPVDVQVFRLDNTGKPVAYTEGEDPVALPHEVQALPGNKFTTRVLREAGSYYIRVIASHPEYKLRTRVYDPPPYAQEPSKAVQTAIDFLLGAGDSWHANTPRRGGILDRSASVHQETSLCVGCHPTHFTQRAVLYAARQGYPVHMRPQLQFLAERFYNNPRPLYGMEKDGAVWARVISAPANVLGRMSHLLHLYEGQITMEPRLWFHNGVAAYLKPYYAGRTALPADETNGNTPLVSTYEVAWYAWEVTRDPAIAALIERDEIKNTVDLCYQTLALAAIDPLKHRAKLASNAERILSLQRPSGQWAMRFESNAPEVEFQTGHALWALHAAGVPRSHPRVAKALAYLLSRQQEFGGWMDPLQSYENFRTPFRETQMAVLALSAYYPEKPLRPGWNAPEHKLLSANDAELIVQMDELWGPQNARVLTQLRMAAVSPDALLRQQAIEALGRIAPPAALVTLIPRLGDNNKLVQRTAAWAVRQIYSRRQGQNPSLLLGAFRGTPRLAWGAVRVFANHFAALARYSAYSDLLSQQLAAGPAVAMQAAKALWQFWFWSADPETRDHIESRLISALQRQDLHPWVERAVREGIYNIADDNIRYLYNNWVPLLPRTEDRERIIRGRLAEEARLATKFASVFEKGSDLQKRRLLSALVEFPLRRADVYDPKADLSRTAPPVYNRIGNDIEQIAFFGVSAERIARALRPLLAHADGEISRLAHEALLMVRDPRFGEVEKIAGSTTPLRAELQTVLAAKQEQHPDVWRAFRPPQPPSVRTAPAAASRTRARPDEAYFRGYVQPILEKRGRDGVACVHCHATHTLFDGTFAGALRVVDLDEPENSLILRKPTSSAESEGVANSGTLPHGGGVRWEKGSPEYNTILEWIRGAKP